MFLYFIHYVKTIIMSDFEKFVDFCISLGISKSYFDEACYEYLENNSTFADFNDIYKYELERVKNLFPDDELKESLLSRGYIYNIEYFIKEDLIHRKILHHFDDFNIHSTEKIINYFENLNELEHNYTVDDVEQKYNNWKVIYVIMNLLKNLCCSKYSIMLDRLLFETNKKYGISLASENYFPDSDNTMSNFYKSQLDIAKNVHWLADPL